MKTRQVALLRGVNVGRAQRIAMADLRALVEDLGYTGVRTVLNSGNVVFTAGAKDSAAAAQRIEEALQTGLGIASRVFVLAAPELASAIAANPLERVARDPSRLLLAVTATPATHAKLAPLAQRSWEPEAFALGERVAYLWCAAGIIESRLVQAMNRALGADVTTRNWTTMTKLLALAQDAA